MPCKKIIVSGLDFPMKKPFVVICLLLFMDKANKRLSSSLVYLAFQFFHSVIMRSFNKNDDIS